MSSHVRARLVKPRVERERPTEARPPDEALIKGDATRERGMVVWVQVALLAIATNAVLIQTIITEDSNLKNVIRAVVLLITVFVIFVRRTIVPGWIIGLVLFSASLALVTLNPDQLTVVYVLLLVPALWSIGERALTRALMIASLFALLLVFLFLAAGLTTNELRVSQTWVSADVRARYTFGTAGVPFFMNLVYGAAVMIIYYVNRWRLRGRGLVTVGTLIGAAWIFTQTDGRGGFASILVFCALAILMPLLCRSRFIHGILALQPVIYLGFGVWLATQRHSPEINQLFSFRPMLYGQFLDGITLWDALASTTVKQGVVSTVDSSYLHLLFGAGLVVFVVFCFMFAIAVTTMARRSMYLELAFLTSVMGYAILESILLRAENIFILFAWYLVMRYSMGERIGNLSMQAMTPSARAARQSGGRGPVQG